jgi:hypothetical protein
VSVDTATSARRSRWSGGAVTLTVVSVLVLGTTMTWAFFAMRSVMDVGGACADGGPYVSSQPCPDGSWLIAVAIPAMVIFAMAGSAAAISVQAPNLLIPMWGFLFGSLGWNFLEYGVWSGGIVWGWLICGVMFWAMALPAVYGILLALAAAVIPSRKKGAAAGSRWWVPAYSLLGATGFLVGAWSYHAIS